LCGCRQRYAQIAAGIRLRQPSVLELLLHSFCFVGVLSKPPEACVDRPFTYMGPRGSAMSDKFIALTVAFILSASAAVFVQSRPVDEQTNGVRSGGVMQAQRKTGPIATKRGGAPASSPRATSSTRTQASCLRQKFN